MSVLEFGIWNLEFHKNALALPLSNHVFLTAEANPSGTMKRLLLPLIVASPILAALAPHAEAAAITFDSGALHSRLLGPASLRMRGHTGASGSVFRASVETRASKAINHSLLSGVTLSVNGGVVKTGAGTLVLTGANTFSGATLTIGSSEFMSDGTLVAGSSVSRSWAVTDPVSALRWLGGVEGGGTIDTNSFDVRITAANLLSRGTLEGAGTAALGGTNTINTMGGTLIVNAGTLSAGVSQTLGALNIDASGIVMLNSTPPAPITDAGSAASAAAPAPVPEPGTAVLFAIGMFAASQARRRRTS